MTYEANKVGTVKGLGEIYQVSAPLGEQIKAFQAVGVSHPYLVTPEEVVDIRLAGVSDDFSRTSVASLATKGENTILYKASPLMNPALALVAVNAHGKGNYPQLPREFYDVVKSMAKAQEGMEPEDRTALVVSRKGDFDLTPDMPDTRFNLGRRAKEYFDKKGHKTIKFYDLISDSKDATDVNYLWFGSPQGGSSLGARSGDLNDDSRAFGVLRTGGASAQKNGYSLTEIGNANSEIVPVVFNEAGLSGLTNTIARPLTKGLLERLRAGK